MIIPFEQLGNHDFALSDISVICQRPSYRQLNIKKRPCNGFVYLTKGSCSFTFARQRFTMDPGALAYLPLASKHVFDITSDEVEFYRVNFTLRVGAEAVLFSEHPVLLTDCVSPECADIIRQLEEHCRLGKDTVEETAKLCAIFSSLREGVAKPYSTRLAPAVTYLQRHLTEQINCHHLASLCYLSTMQFYNLFNADFGMTPLQYRNKLLVSRAIMLLKLGDISITEISEMLGFSDPSYFSRFFKKHAGCSPKQFTQKIINTR